MCHRPARRLGQHQGSTLMYHVVLRGALLMLLGILASAHAFANATVLEVFVRDGCPHCSAAKAHLAELSTQHPELEIRLRDVDRGPAARADLLRLSRDAGRRQCRHSSSLIRCTTCFAVLALSCRKLAKRPGGTLKLISGAVMLPRGVVSCYSRNGCSSRLPGVTYAGP